MKLTITALLFLTAAGIAVAEPAKGKKEKAEPAAAAAAKPEAAAKEPAKAAAAPAEPAQAPAPGAAPAAVPEPEPIEPETLIGNFYAALQKKDVEGAYDNLTRGTKIAERAEDVKTLKSKTKDAITVFGLVKGFDIVSKKNVGQRLTSYTCVSLGSDFPLRWRFYFYKPENRWKLIDLRVDDRLGSIFEEPEESKGGEASRE